MLPLRGTQVQFLVRELRSHKTGGAAKKKKKKEEGFLQPFSLLQYSCNSSTLVRTLSSCHSPHPKCLEASPIQWTHSKLHTQVSDTLHGHLPPFPPCLQPIITLLQLHTFPPSSVCVSHAHTIIHTHALLVWNVSLGISSRLFHRQAVLPGPGPVPSQNLSFPVHKTEGLD